MLLLFLLLANNSVHHCLQDVLLGQHALHVLYQLVRLVNLVVFQVVYHQVEPCLRDHVEQRREDLQCVLTPAEGHQVVSEKVVVLEDIAGGRGILKLFKLSLGCFAVVELVMVARLEVYADD